MTLAPLSLFLVATLFVPERLRRSPPLIAYALLSGVFIVWQQSLETALTGLGGTRLHGSFFAAHTCLSCGALALFGPRASRVRLAWGVLFGASALCFAGAGFPNWLARQASWTQALPGLSEHLSPRMFFALAVSVCGLLSALAFRAALPHRELGASLGAGRGVRLAFLALTAALALTLSEATAYTLRANYNDLSSLYVQIARGLRLKASGGFSGKAELGDVLAEQGVDGGRGVALEVLSTEKPGYLRGRVFLRYTGRGWDVGLDRLGAPADQDDLGRWVLPGRGSPAAREADLIVRPAARYEAILFTPLDLQAVLGPESKVVRHAGGVLHSLTESTADGYKVWKSEEPIQAEALDPGNLELPDDPELLAALDEHIAAARLRGPAGEALPPRALLRRLATHFDRRYQYKFGITFDEGSDPLTQFLRVKKHGHCELFASSATLILRRLGIRARYVTGFVCAEQNEYDPELWIARNKMAHAWVEAYHPATGWKTLEFTPGSAIPQISQASWSESLMEWLQGQWTRFKSIPWRELPAHLVALARSLVAWIFAAWYRVALLFALALAFVAWRRSKRPPPAPPARVRTFPPALATAREAYLAQETLLATFSLARGAAETLLAQAERLRGSEWPDTLPLDKAEVVAGIEALAVSRYGPSAASETPPARPAEP